MENEKNLAIFLSIVFATLLRIITYLKIIHCVHVCRLFLPFSKKYNVYFQTILQE